MRTLLTTIFILISTPLFAAKSYERMSLSEIYDRGYAIEASVKQDRGILAHANQHSILLGRKKNSCILYLNSKKVPKEDTLLFKDKKILFPAFKYEVSTFKSRGGLLITRYTARLAGVENSKIQRLWFTYPREPLLVHLKRKCTKFNFKVVENKLEKF